MATASATGTCAKGCTSTGFGAMRIAEPSMFSGRIDGLVLILSCCPSCVHLFVL